MKFDGIVIQGHGKSFIVRSQGKNIKCEIRGKVKHVTDAVTPVAVGDAVTISLISENTGMIEAVGRRRSMLFRPSKGSDRKKQVIAANIDQLAVVASVKSPPLKPGLIDRFLIAADIGGLEPLVVINKIDLYHPEILKEIAEGYKSLNIPFYPISAETGDGFEILENALTNHKTIFAGHSGVGKSTILNRIIPGLDLKIGPVSEYSNKGVHTTSRVQLFELPQGGFVVDTPGLKVLGLWNLEKEDVQYYFPEFDDFREKCRFTGCSHIPEPDCAVKEAVEKGEIARFRYTSYVSIYKSL